MALEMTGTVSILKVGIFKRRFSSDMSITGRNLPFFLDLVKRRENQKGESLVFISLTTPVSNHLGRKAIRRVVTSSFMMT